MRCGASTNRAYRYACYVLFGLCPLISNAAPGDVAIPETQAPQVDIIGHYATDLGTTDAASQGSVTYKLLEDRPILRPGEFSNSSLGWSSRNTAATAKPINTSCAVTTSTTGPTSQRTSKACRSTCPRMRTGKATPTSTS